MSRWNTRSLFLCLKQGYKVLKQVSVLIADGVSYSEIDTLLGTPGEVACL